jgi:phosphoribosylformylglycinamidine synthase
VTRVTVTVRPKPGILDPQGEALRRSLRGLGYPIASVHAGKLFDLELDVADAAEARRIAEDVAARVLANPLIEAHHVELDLELTA